MLQTNSPCCRRIQDWKFRKSREKSQSRLVESEVNQNDVSNKTWSLAECVEIHVSTSIKKLERRTTVSVLESKPNKRWKITPFLKTGVVSSIANSLLHTDCLHFPPVHQDILAIASSAPQHVFRYDAVAREVWIMIESPKYPPLRNNGEGICNQFLCFHSWLQALKWILKRLVKWLH